MDYSIISTGSELNDLVSLWAKDNINSVAMDFEEESNLHCYGEYVCIIQVFDRTNYYIIDCLKISKEKEGLEALKAFLEGPIEKVMFSCQSDAALSRKALKIQLKNIYDIRILALALEFTGNLTSLEERYLGQNIDLETSSSSKKRFQTANWMRRPISEAQIQYALGDVQYLFELKDILEKEVQQLPKFKKREIQKALKTCAEPKHPERPGWEKICNYKMLSKKEKVLVKYFFLARDSVAKAHNVPASQVLLKQKIIAMAKEGTWENEISCCNPAFRKELEKTMQQVMEKASKLY